MDSNAIDKIVGETPDFILQIELRHTAQQYLDENGKWTHIAGLDEAGGKLFDAMVKLGIADKGEAVPDDGGKTLCVYRLKAKA